MEDLNQHDTFNFDLPKNQSSVIKVIGVGGGGSNAVNHMYRAGIKGVDFVVCNTDSQALENSPIPNKIQLGVTLTEGLGAGANPEVGQQAAIENIDEIKSVLNTNTKMIFITAGMGGGTGTGAAPVIAKAAMECGILTVGIVTMPFLFEGNQRRNQAERGIEALRQHVDSLIVINNNKLREVYGNLGFKAGFSKADEVLATAARGIAEVITHHYTTNIDLRDAKTVLANSGTAIMGSGSASGENRAVQAISAALDSPLLNDNHIHGAKNVLLLIVSGQEEITIDEIGEINDFIQNEAGGSANIIMGIGEDESLANEIAVTIVATGFAADQQVQVIGREPQKVVHTLEDEQAISTSVYEKPLAKQENDDLLEEELNKAKQKLRDQQNQPDLFSDAQSPKQIQEEVVEEPKEEPIRYALEEEEEIEELETPHFETYTEVEEVEEVVEEPVVEGNLEVEADLETSEDEEKAYSISKDEDDSEEHSFEFEVFTLNEEHDQSEERVELDEEVPQAQAQPEAEQKPVEPQKDELPKEEMPKAKVEDEKPTIVRHSLEDYLAFEKSLKDAKPTPKNNSPKVELEDEDLRFELKTKSEVESPVARESQRSYEDMPIEESLRLKQEERRAQLKQFNHRFKAHNLNSIEKAETVPAYKRRGLEFENAKYSDEKRMGRFTIDDSVEGSDIKSNNSFLHDNVD